MRILSRIQCLNNGKNNCSHHSSMESNTLTLYTHTASMTSAYLHGEKTAHELPTSIFSWNENEVHFRYIALQRSVHKIWLWDERDRRNKQRNWKLIRMHMSIYYCLAVLIKDENGRNISRTKPHSFLRLIRSNSYFQINLNLVRNTKYRMGRKQFRCFWTIFYFFYFL